LPLLTLFLLGGVTAGAATHHHETGVLGEGVLEPGVVLGDIPTFTPDGAAGDYLDSAEWHGLLSDWESRLRRHRAP